MIFLAHYHFDSLPERKFGDFSYIVEACSQEAAEIQLQRLLEGAVKNPEWFPAPCRIMLARLAVTDAIPPTGIAFHQRLTRPRICGGDGLDVFPMAHLPPRAIHLLSDWSKEIASGHFDPVPLFVVDHHRNLTVPVENVPPIP